MLFGFGKSTFLGVDFGTSSIKAVELAQKENGPVLINCAKVPLQLPEKKAADGRSYDELIALHLRALISRMKPASKEVYVAIPAFSGLVTLIDMPEMDEKELDQAIKFEAHKYIPSSLDDLILSWDTVGYWEKQGDRPATMEILLVAALKKDVGRYQEYLKKANLSMKLLELETFSLVRAIIGEKPGVSLIIDIGARATNLVLVHDGRVKVSRNIDGGGNDLTRTLMESMGITQERAETLKKSQKDFLNTPQSSIIFPVLQTITAEAQRILSAYQAKHPEAPVAHAMLSGGTAQLTGLVTYLEKIFKIPVVVGNPWETVRRESSGGFEIDSSFFVALGLALSGMENPAARKKYGKKSPSLKEILNKKI